MIKKASECVDRLDMEQQKKILDNLYRKISDESFKIMVIGEFNSGKSTFIQHLNGLLLPTSGHVYVEGEDIHSSREKARDARFKVGLVFQYPEYQLFEETVYADIAFGPKNMGLNEDEVDKRVREAAG